jgi:hypothetical protein
MSRITFDGGFTTNAAGHGLVELTRGELAATFLALDSVLAGDFEDAAAVVGRNGSQVAAAARAHQIIGDAMHATARGKR